MHFWVCVRNWHLRIRGRRCSGLCSRNAQEAYVTRRLCAQSRLNCINHSLLRDPSMRVLSWFSRFGLTAKGPCVLGFAKLLNSVLAPGCRDFGCKAFAECCSLQWVYASEGVANMFSNEAKFGQYLFQGCINLAEFTLSELPSPRGSTLQARTSELAPGCLSSAGITALALTKHFTAIGAHACDSCGLLKSETFATPMLKKFRNSPLCTALASEKFSFRLLSIQSESKPL